jgi:glycerophosphoryl diester phosphodiesterase
VTAPEGGVPGVWPQGRRSAADVLRISHRAGDVGPASYGAANLAHQAGLGAHLLEFDVRVTSDGELVVHHDGSVALPGGGTAKLRDLTLVALRGALGPDVPVPLVADVVRDAARAGLGLYADVKALTPAGADRLVAVLEANGVVGRTILASGRPKVVRLCAAAAPTLPRAVLFWEPDVDPRPLAESCDATFVHPCWEWLPVPHEHLAARPWLAPVRADGLGVVCWHEERRAVVEGLYDLGVDGICGDDTALLTAVATAHADPT